MKQFLACLALLLLLHCGECFASEPIYSNYDVKVVEEVPSSSYDPIDLSGPINSGISADQMGTVGGSIFSNGSTTGMTYSHDRLIIVGDSRTVGMAQALGATQVATDVYCYNNYEYFIAKVGEGYNWLSSTAVNLINQYKTQKTALVFWLGINDYAMRNDQYNLYAQLIQSNAGGWGCDLYYGDITPLRNGKDDTTIQTFNNTLKQRLAGGVTWISLWSLVKQMGDSAFAGSDTIHYNSDTSKAIYQQIKNSVGSIGVSKTIVSAGSSSGGESFGQGGILFFTQYESGDAGYAQTGGDNGNAYGKYQFDYRYSLYDMIKYAYQKNPTIFSDFAQFMVYGSRSNFTTWYESDKSNNCRKVSQAWSNCYNRSPQTFKQYQDEYAYNAYYVPARDGLLSKGININNRSDIAKGSVFSYSIQHGSGTAVSHISSVVNNTMSDRDFVTAVYDKRISSYPAYSTRYNSEKLQALTLLG